MSVFELIFTGPVFSGSPSSRTSRLVVRSSLSYFSRRYSGLIDVIQFSDLLMPFKNARPQIEVRDHPLIELGPIRRSLLWL